MSLAGHGRATWRSTLSHGLPLTPAQVEHSGLVEHKLKSKSGQFYVHLMRVHEACWVCKEYGLDLAIFKRVLLHIPCDMAN